MNIRYLCKIHKKTYEWEINGVKVELAYLSEGKKDVLEGIINKIEFKLRNYQPIMENENVNKFFGIANVIRISVAIFPELTRKFISCIVTQLEKEKVHLGKSIVFHYFLRNDNYSKKKNISSSYKNITPQVFDIICEELDISLSLNNINYIPYCEEKQVIYFGKDTINNNSVYLWSIKSRQVCLRNVKEGEKCILIKCINTIKVLLERKEELITGKSRNQLTIGDTMIICKELFPNLTQKYIKSLILSNVENKTQFNIISLLEKMFGKKDSLYNNADNTYFTDFIVKQICLTIAEIYEIEYSEIYENIEELNIHKVEKLKGYKYLWSIANKEVELTLFQERDVELVSILCIIIKRRLQCKKALIMENEMIQFINYKISMKPIMYICSNIFGNLMYNYLKYFANNYTRVRELISLSKIYQEVFSYRSMSNEATTICEEFDKMVRDIVEQEADLQYKILPDTNFTEGTKEVNWRFFFRREGHDLQWVTFNLSSIIHPVLRAEVKYFLVDKLKHSQNFEEAQRDISRFSMTLNYLSGNFKDINCCADISKHMVINLKNYLKTEAKTQNTKKLLSVNTQAKLLKKCKKLFDFLMYTDMISTRKPSSNPFATVTYHNMHNLHKNTDVIPEEIIEQILLYIDDLIPIYQRILLVALNTGLRFKEVASLEENCLKWQNEQKVWKLYYIPWKILEARRNSNLDDYTYTVINEVIVKEINDQKKETESLRKRLKTNQIFLKEKNKYTYETISTVNARSFNTAINRLIKKHKIVDTSGQLWKFSSKQCRKTLAVAMIDNGAHPKEVTYKLGHMSEQTTNRFYNEVKKMKLAEMNSEFFQNKFKLIITDEQLKNYKEEERKLLYIEFCNEYREVELGKCSKLFTEGECKREGDFDVSCSTCNKLCISPESKPKWVKLRDSKLKIISKLISLYEKEGIEKEEYSKFREFEKENYLLNSYEAVITKINEFNKNLK